MSNNTGMKNLKNFCQPIKYVFVRLWLVCFDRLRILNHKIMNIYLSNSRLVKIVYEYIIFLLIPYTQNVHFVNNRDVLEESSCLVIRLIFCCLVLFFCHSRRLRMVLKRTRLACERLLSSPKEITNWRW